MQHACQLCRAAPATGVLVTGRAAAPVALVCRGDCCVGDAPALAALTHADARATFGFLVDRNEIPRLKPHSGLVHQYLAYRGCTEAARALGVASADAYWVLFAGAPRFVPARLLAGVVWNDMPLANVRGAREHVSAEEAADLPRFLARVLTRETMDAFADPTGEFVSVVPFGVALPYLAAPDAAPFRMEPAPAWALAFGAALVLPDVLAPGVHARNAVFMYEHPALQPLHCMRGTAAGTTSAQALAQTRACAHHLLGRAVMEKDAFPLGVLVHTLADGFSRAHVDRDARFPCRILGVRAVDEDGDEATGHAALESAAAVFADAAREQYTPEYARLIPAARSALGFVYWYAACAAGTARGTHWSVPTAWLTDHKWIDPALTFTWDDTERADARITRAVDYLFYAYFRLAD